MSNNKVMQDPKLTPAQRAEYFSRRTRKNMQMLPAIAGAASSTITFDLPKARLLSKIRLLVTATLNARHAANPTYAASTFGPYELLRRVSVSMNNGFIPFILSGRELFWYNLVRSSSAEIMPVFPTVATTLATVNRSRAVQEVQAAAAPGADNIVKFMVDLPISLNDRDPIGLFLLQAPETVVTVSIDFDTVNSIAPAAAGYTFALSNVVVTPMVETFSVPSDARAMPDLNILKLVQSTRKAIAGAGVEKVDLPTGNTFRRLLVYLETAAGVGWTDGALTGDFELIFNQADIPYRLNPNILSGINQEEFANINIPQGLYIFDFSYQGLPGYGGSRDFIDTERLTEFWFRFNAPAAGQVTCVYEFLSRLNH